MGKWSEITKKLVNTANWVKDEALEIFAETADSTAGFTHYTKNKARELNAYARKLAAELDVAAGKAASDKCFKELTKNGATLKNYNTGELLNQPLEWISYPPSIFSEFKHYCAKEYLFQGYQSTELEAELPSVDNHAEL
jgi:hypothetical protein